LANFSLIAAMARLSANFRLLRKTDHNGLSALCEPKNGSIFEWDAPIAALLFG
jgi:hypothetical protein